MAVQEQINSKDLFFFKKASFYMQLSEISQNIELDITKLMMPDSWEENSRYVEQLINLLLSQDLTGCSSIQKNQIAMLVLNTMTAKHYLVRPKVNAGNKDLFDEVIRTIIQAQRLATDPEVIAFGHYVLSTVYRGYGRNAECVSEARAAFEIINKISDADQNKSVFYGHVLNNLALGLIRLSDTNFEEAKKYIDQAISIAQKTECETLDRASLDLGALVSYSEGDIAVRSYKNLTQIMLTQSRKIAAKIKSGSVQDEAEIALGKSSATDAFNAAQYIFAECGRLKIHETPPNRAYSVNVLGEAIINKHVLWDLPVTFDEINNAIGLINAAYDDFSKAFCERDDGLFEDNVLRTAIVLNECNKLALEDFSNKCETFFFIIEHTINGLGIDKQKAILDRMNNTLKPYFNDGKVSELIKSQDFKSRLECLADFILDKSQELSVESVLDYSKKSAASRVTA